MLPGGCGKSGHLGASDAVPTAPDLTFPVGHVAWLTDHDEGG